jgi:subtilase family serine protease
VISQSFSATEQTFTGLGQINQYHLRSAYVAAAASGDSGVADVELDETTYYLHRVTSWPDSDPLVTGVGGTELVAGKDGGLSELFSRPFYQDGVKNVAGTARGVPDVSMNGACSSPVFTYQSYPQQGTPAGWYPACGTSESTPEFAGIVALADQVAGHPLGLINPRPYWLSAERAPGIVPVTSGNNTVTFTQGRAGTSPTNWPATGRRGNGLSSRLQRRVTPPSRRWRCPSTPPATADPGSAMCRPRRRRSACG